MYTCTVKIADFSSLSFERVVGSKVRTHVISKRTPQPPLPSPPPPPPPSFYVPDDSDEDQTYDAESCRVTSPTHHRSRQSSSAHPPSPSPSTSVNARCGWLVVTCLTPQQQTGVSQGRICSDECAYCLTETEMQIQLSVSPSHSMPTPGQPALGLTL